MLSRCNLIQITPEMSRPIAMIADLAITSSITYHKSVMHLWAQIHSYSLTNIISHINTHKCIHFLELQDFI